MTDLAILGAGSWGTALSIVLAPRFPKVRLWTYETDLCERMTATRENDVYLPGFRIPENVTPLSDVGSAVHGAEIALLVTPSHHMRRISMAIVEGVRQSTLFVSAAKGLENDSLLRMSQVLTEVIGRRFTPQVSVISGPTFAREVAAGEPTALVVAAEDRELACTIQKAFNGPTFRLYTNTDVTGVEIGGALKNVIAIGAGICHGLGLGNNAVAALVTRGLAEITRLAVALGGEPRTLSGLTGLGDLVLTCTGDLSRNRQLGIALGQGRKLDEIIRSSKTVAEGVQTTYAASDLAKRMGIDMPITDRMNAMLREGKCPKEALRELMERALKGE